MKQQCINAGWSVSSQARGSSSEKVSVSLPHDWSITQPRSPKATAGAAGGFFQGADLSYERLLEVPVEGLAVLEFEGVYCNAEIRLNGHLVHRHHYGYTGFLVDISEMAKRDEPNRLKVNAYANARPDSRWYTGAGIYRPVWLHTTSHASGIHPFGLYVETLSASSDKADIRVHSRIIGETKGVSLCYEVLDARGKLLLAGSIPSCTHKGFIQDLIILNPHLWCAENPHLYTLRCRLLHAGLEIDKAETQFGVRTIALCSKRGLLINGEVVKLRGGCVHHDNGMLGAASFPCAEERKVMLLKASGFNAVRCAHNPPAPAFLRACDRMGLYVMDEAFDVWQDGKNPYDYHNYFHTDWSKDLDSMVMRDRRHPSVIIWSIGNEIPERDGRLDGYTIAHTLTKRVRGLDGTRPVINCLNQVSQLTELTNLELNLLQEDPGFDLWAARTTPFVRDLDLVGYNYLLGRYCSDQKKFPERIICGTESFPMEAYDNWRAIDDLPYVIGDFVWSAIDYLGEAGLGHVWREGETGFLGSWPWHLANCGDLDICGNKRPQSYYRDAVWRIDKSPCIAALPPEKHGQPCEVSKWGWPDVELFWNFPGSEGKMTMVEVYSSSDEIELCLNNEVIGRQQVVRCRACFELSYYPGILRAIAYTAGRKVGESVLETPGTAERLMLEESTPGFIRPGGLAYIRIKAVDREGRVVNTMNSRVHVSVTEGRLLALGAADPTSTEGYAGPSRSLYRGEATAIVQNVQSNRVQVTVQCTGLPTSELILNPSDGI